MALLVACARTTLLPEDRVAAERAIEAGIDWERLPALAERHGVLPLVHRHLGAEPLRAHVPAAAAEALGRIGRMWGARGLWMANELATLLGELSARGIAALPFKGPLLAQQLYGSAALRQVVDLDILVRPHDLPSVAELLVARGFTTPSWGAAEVDALALAHSKDVTFHAPPPSWLLELHVGLQAADGRASYGFDDFADRLTTTSFMGVETLAFPPEELLAYLCAHGAGHAWSRLSWVCDVAELLRRGLVTDWRRVDEAARLLGATRRVASGVRIAHELLGAPLPAGAPRGDRWARSAARQVVRRTLAGNGGEPTQLELFGHKLRTDASAAARARRVLRLLRPSVADRVTLPLPEPLRPLYVMLRPLRLFLTHGAPRWLRTPTRPGERGER